MKSKIRVLACLTAILLCFSIMPVNVSAGVGSYGVDLTGTAYRSSNPFYISGWGSDYENGYGGQCTWYAWGRAYEKLGEALPCRGNATNWTYEASANGYSTGTQPRGNAIMVSHSGTYGHVLFVEYIADGYAYVTEGNYNGYYHEDAINLSSMTRDSTGASLGDVDFIYLYDPPVPSAPSIWMSNDTFKTGDYIVIEFGDWGYATSFEYYISEYPEAFAYTTNAGHGTVDWISVGFSSLPAGHYSAFVHAKNSAGTSAQSNWVTFDIYDNDYIPVTVQEYNGHFYAVYDYSMSWTFARDLCIDMGGHLVTINSIGEDEFIDSLIQSGSMNAYWIGASNYTGYSQNPDGPWTWVTEEDFSYTNWASGEPSSSGEKGEREHWAEKRKSLNGKWNDVKNTNKQSKGFIIEIEPEESSITAREFYNGNEYLLIDRNTTWTEAEAYCELLGGHLVCVNDSAEEAFLDSFISLGTRSWYYVGASRSNGTWNWVDGTQADSINWNGALWGDHCNYLMKYKASKKYINLPNTYYPEEDIAKIGFVCEIEHSDTYTIEYDANGGASPPAAQTKTHGVALTLSTAIPIRSGYTFMGWATSSTASSAQYQPGDSYTANENVTLYAVWIKDVSPVPDAIVTVGSANGSPGSEVLIPVSITDNPGIASFEFDVIYDDTVLEWTGLEKASIGGTWDATVGESILWIDADNYIADGTIFTLKFRVMDSAQSGTTVVTVSYDEENVFDENGDNVSLGITDGTVTVFTHIPGDINGDGSVNNKDLLWLMKWIKGKDVIVVPEALDVNGDGSRNNKDLLWLMKYLKGKDVVIY